MDPPTFINSPMCRFQFQKKKKKDTKHKQHNLQENFFSMAITHNDLIRRAGRSTYLSGQLALFLVVLSVLCGLISFVLCLAAEATRSEAIWYLASNKGDGTQMYQCTYTGSGKAPLTCAVCAFLLLAIAMFAEHAYMLVAATTTPRTAAAPPAPAAWPPAPSHPALSSARRFTTQTCVLFITIWLCFAIAEVLLIVGMGVESGHMNRWWNPKPGCHVMRPGAFAVAGILGLITVLLGIGLYLTALQSERLSNADEHMRRGSAPGFHHHYPLPTDHAAAGHDAQIKAPASA